MVPEKILAYLVENLAVGYKSTFKSTCYQFMQLHTNKLYKPLFTIFSYFPCLPVGYWRVYTLYVEFSHSLYRNLKQTKYLELKQDKG